MHVFAALDLNKGAMTSAPRVQQWPAAVAWVDCRIRLDPSPNKNPCTALDTASQPRNHPRGEGVVKPKGVANGKHLLPHAEPIRVTEGHWTQQRWRCVDSDDR